MTEREPAPEKIRIPDVRILMQEAFPGCDVMLQHGIRGNQAELKFDEYEMRVLLSGPPEKKTASIRFVQRIERGKMRVLFDKRTDDWYEIEAAIKEVRAFVIGLLHSLKKATTPKRVHVQNDLNDLFLDD